MDHEIEADGPEEKKPRKEPFFLRKFHEMKNQKARVMTYLPQLEDLVDLTDCQDVIFEVDSNLFKSRVPHDGGQWSDRKKDKNHKIRYGTFTLEGSKYDAADCKNVDDAALTKQIYKSELKTYISYSYANGKYTPPHSHSAARLTEKDTEIIRDALIGRTCKAAKKYLDGKGMVYDEIKIRNQKKYVEEAVASKSGPKIRTEETTLVNLQKLHSTFAKFEQMTDDNGESGFRYMYIDEEALSVYMNTCPTSVEVEKQKIQVEKLASETKNVQRKYISKFCEEYPEGSKFPSRLTIDTTFMLGDFYVTVLLGELPPFRTSSSNKPRNICIAFMVHTSKGKVHHEAFAVFLREKLMKLASTKKSCPAIIVDGEESLLVYAQAFNCPSLRCSRHILDNLATKSSKSLASDVQKILFGVKTPNNVLTSGILLAFSENELIHRIQAAKGRLTDDVTKWLLDRSQLLFEKSSTYAQLRCGQFVQFQTTNSVECFNNIIKGFVQKPISADRFICLFTNEITDAVNELTQSLYGISKTVTCDKATEFATASLEEQKTIQDSLGFLSGAYALWNIPPTLAFALDRKIMRSQERKSQQVEVYRTGDVFTVAETVDSGKKYTVIDREATTGSLKCCCPSLPQSICFHLFGVLHSLEESKRNEELLKISNFVRKLSVKALNLNPRSVAGLKAPKRKGKSQSRNNKKRTIADVLEATFFLNDGSSDSEEDRNSSSDTTEGEVEEEIENSSEIGRQTEEENENSEGLDMVEQTNLGLNGVGQENEIRDFTVEEEQINQHAPDDTPMTENKLVSIQDTTVVSSTSLVEGSISRDFSFKVFNFAHTSTPKDQSVGRAEENVSLVEMTGNSDEDGQYGTRVWNEKIMRAIDPQKRTRKPKRSFSPE